MNLAKNVKFKTETKFDPRFASLVRTIRWQGRAIILMVAFILGLALYKTVLWRPDEKAVNQISCKPEMPLQSPEYSSFIYQGSTSVRYGDVVKTPTIVLMGQLNDYVRVLKQWPEIRFLLNGAAVPLSSYGNYMIEMNLKPGINTIETSLQMGDALTQRKQITLTYLPDQATDKVLGPVIAPTSTSAKK